MDMVTWLRRIASTIHHKAYNVCKFALFLDSDYHTNSCLYLHNHETSLYINVRGVQGKCSVRYIDKESKERGSFLISLMAERWLHSLNFFLVMVALHRADASVPAMFILGDSIADVGTNSLLPFSIIRADFPYNGIDFPSSQPTGRFSNGFNIVDFIG